MVTKEVIRMKNYGGDWFMIFKSTNVRNAFFAYATEKYEHMCELSFVRLLSDNGMEIGRDIKRDVIDGAIKAFAKSEKITCEVRN